MDNGFSLSFWDMETSLHNNFKVNRNRAIRSFAQKIKMTMIFHELKDIFSFWILYLFAIMEIENFENCDNTLSIESWIEGVIQFHLFWLTDVRISYQYRQ